MNDKKICFILCSNNQLYLDECLLYIQQLEIPRGYTIDAISITDAKSMTAGYNAGMKETDAKYKVYLHQDVFITYKGFLRAILQIFNSDKNIGMIGVVGTPHMSASGVMWFGQREGGLHLACPCKISEEEYEYSLEDGLHEVEAIDGLIMITSVDLPWREDVFDGWDYYDVSQSFEFIKKGYRVVVPEQKNPWCLHDDGKLNFSNYNIYRNKAMLEYPEFFRGIKAIRKKDGIKEHCQLAILMVTHNQIEIVKQQIKILKLFHGKINVRFIVLDNGSTDGLVDWLQEQEEVEYISWELKRENYAVILNTALLEMQIEQDVFLTTPVAFVLPGTLEIMYETLHKNEAIGAAIPKVLYWGEGEITSFHDALDYVQKKEHTQNIRCIDKLPVCGVMIKNEMLQDIKKFNEEMILPQDVIDDFGYKVLERGFGLAQVDDALICMIQ